MLDSSDYRIHSFIPHHLKCSDSSLDIELYDSHCHLGFIKNPEDVALVALERGIGALSCTVTPHEYLTLEPVFREHANIHLALGLHPWWAMQAHAELNQFLELLPHVSFVGEVGLDFSPRYENFDEAQISTLQTIFQACAEAGEKTISLHCVHAYDEMLGLLHATDVTDTCQCIFHWFSGTNDQLNSAIKLGCSFSVGRRMLDTKRGRAYVRQIPTEQLLTETDMPDVDARDPKFEPVEFNPDAWISELQETKRMLLNEKK